MNFVDLWTFKIINCECLLHFFDEIASSFSFFQSFILWIVALLAACGFVLYDSTASLNTIIYVTLIICGCTCFAVLFVLMRFGAISLPTFVTAHFALQMCVNILICLPTCVFHIPLQVIAVYVYGHLLTFRIAHSCACYMVTGICIALRLALHSAPVGWTVAMVVVSVALFCDNFVCIRDLKLTQDTLSFVSSTESSLRTRAQVLDDSVGTISRVVPSLLLRYFQQEYNEVFAPTVELAVVVLHVLPHTAPVTDKESPRIDAANMHHILSQYCNVIDRALASDSSSARLPIIGNTIVVVCGIPPARDIQFSTASAFGVVNAVVNANITFREVPTLFKLGIHVGAGVPAIIGSKWPNITVQGPALDVAVQAAYSSPLLTVTITGKAAFVYGGIPCLEYLKACTSIQSLETASCCLPHPVGMSLQQIYLEEESNATFSMPSNSVFRRLRANSSGSHAASHSGVSSSDVRDEVLPEESIASLPGQPDGVVTRNRAHSHRSVSTSGSHKSVPGLGVTIPSVTSLPTSLVPQGESVPYDESSSSLLASLGAPGPALRPSPTTGSDSHSREDADQSDKVSSSESLQRNVSSLKVSKEPISMDQGPASVVLTSRAFHIGHAELRAVISKAWETAVKEFPSEEAKTNSGQQQEESSLVRLLSTVSIGPSSNALPKKEKKLKQQSSSFQNPPLSPSADNLVAMYADLLLEEEGSRSSSRSSSVSESGPSSGRSEPDLFAPQTHTTPRRPVLVADEIGSFTRRSRGNVEGRRGVKNSLAPLVLSPSATRTPPSEKVASPSAYFVLSPSASASALADQGNFKYENPNPVSNRSASKSARRPLTHRSTTDIETIIDESNQSTAIKTPRQFFEEINDDLLATHRAVSSYNPNAKPAKTILTNPLEPRDIHPADPTFLPDVADIPTAFSAGAHVLFTNVVEVINIPAFAIDSMLEAASDWFSLSKFALHFPSEELEVGHSISTSEFSAPLHPQVLFRLIFVYQFFCFVMTVILAIWRQPSALYGLLYIAVGLSGIAWVSYSTALCIVSIASRHHLAIVGTVCYILQIIAFGIFSGHETAILRSDYGFPLLLVWPLLVEQTARCCYSACAWYVGIFVSLPFYFAAMLVPILLFGPAEDLVTTSWTPSYNSSLHSAESDIYLRPIAVLIAACVMIYAATLRTHRIVFVDRTLWWKRERLSACMARIDRRFGEMENICRGIVHPLFGNPLHCVLNPTSLTSTKTLAFAVLRTEDLHGPPRWCVQKSLGVTTRIVNAIEDAMKHLQSAFCAGSSATHYIICFDPDEQLSALKTFLAHVLRLLGHIRQDIVAFHNVTVRAGLAAGLSHVSMIGDRHRSVSVSAENLQVSLGLADRAEPWGFLLHSSIAESVPAIAIESNKRIVDLPQLGLKTAFCIDALESSLFS